MNFISQYLHFKKYGKIKVKNKDMVIKLDKAKEPIIKVKPPKPLWVRAILDNADNFEEDYRRRLHNRIMDVALNKK